eukprot:TRINITY_DN1973_c0_g1_i1.p1 TRINITY_DN1973_c0_g1~~TRINITY_DN1973_c0_g1_i1.p1  ORF type:complete len:173 (+),score=82.43 TRINITY_DN1973_c0_g1_i1:30-521(+)
MSEEQQPQQTPLASSTEPAAEPNQDLAQLLADLDQQVDSIPNAMQASAPNPVDADRRSIYVGNVDYVTTEEELKYHFQNCGIVNRVTIPGVRKGTPKGFAYVEFAQASSVDTALLLNGSYLHNREIKVTHKRTNIPGLRVRKAPKNPYLMYPYAKPHYMYQPY